MASLQQIFGWFSRGLFPTQEQYKQTWSSFWHKSERLPIEQVLGLNTELNDKATKAELANATTKFKGYHSSIDKLLAEYPQAKNEKDFFAWVGSPYPGTVYKVYADGGAWTNTGEVPPQEQLDLADYLKKDNLAQSTGAGVDVVMSQNITTKEIIQRAKVVTGGELLQTDGNYLMCSDGEIQVVSSNAIITPLTRVDVNKAGYLTSSGGVSDDGTSTLYKYTPLLQQIPVEATQVNILGMGGAACSIQFFNSSGNFISAHGNNTGNFTTPLNIAIPNNATQYRYSYALVSDNFKLEFIVDASSIQTIENKNAISLIEVAGGIASKTVLYDLTLSGVKVVQPSEQIKDAGTFLMLSNGSVIVGSGDVSELLMSVPSSDIANNGALIADGSILVNTLYRHSDKLTLPDGARKVKLYGTALSSQSRAIGFYDNSDNLIKTDGQSSASGVWDEIVFVDVPINATKFVCCYNTNSQTPLFEVYTDGSELIENEDKAILINYNGKAANIDILRDFGSTKWVAPKLKKLNVTNADFLYSGAPIPDNGVTILASNQANAMQIKHKAYSTLESLVFTARITPQADNPTVWIGRDRCAAMKIEGVTLTTYIINDALSALVEYKTYTLPFRLLSGNTYLLSVEKPDASNLIYRIISADNEFSIKYNKEESQEAIGTSRPAIAWGTPFFGVIDGHVSIDKLYLASRYVDTLIGIWGDSFIEGATMVVYGLLNRWCALLAERIGINQTVIDGQGGEAINQAFITRFKIENAWFNTPYVIISLGTNNYGNVAGYKTDMQQLVNYLKANNQTPILVTCTPRTGSNYDTTVKVINDWVKASGELYIDMHKAVTDPNDPSKWKSGYVLSDNVHPSVKGHEAMYRQTLIDCPFLLLL